MTKKKTKREVLIERNTTHGMSNRPEYGNWKDMIKRCFNPNNKRYKDYAERGISVHPDFVKSFVKFFEEIGPKPEGKGWSVGRMDNNGWYTYGNLRWENKYQQARNHTKQRNNSSGVTGVCVRTRTISGGVYTTCTARWKDLDGKARTKDFSVDKYGFEKAFDMAVQYRKKKIEELNVQGAEYADSHGSDK